MTGRGWNSFSKVCAYDFGNSLASRALKQCYIEGRKTNHSSVSAVLDNQKL